MYASEPARWGRFFDVAPRTMSPPCHAGAAGAAAPGLPPSSRLHFPLCPGRWPLVALCRLRGLALLSSQFPALIVGLLILTLFLVGRVVGLLAFVPPPRALDLAGVAVDLGLGDEVAPRDLLGLERTPPHRMLHRAVG